jgi:hypothetical protein
MMKNPIEMLKEEICSRYGLNEDQVKFELCIEGVEEEKAKEILKDYAKYEGYEYYNQETKSGHTTSSGDFYWVSVRGPKEEVEEFVIE